MAVQKYLKEDKAGTFSQFGFDGLMGKETSTALKQWQQNSGLTPTGQLDAQTVAKIRPLITPYFTQAAQNSQVNKLVNAASKFAQDVPDRSKAVHHAQQNFATNDTISNPATVMARNNKIVALNAAGVVYNAVLTAFNQGGMTPNDAGVNPATNAIPNEKLDNTVALMKSSLPAIEAALEKMKNYLSQVK